MFTRKLITTMICLTALVQALCAASAFAGTDRTTGKESRKTIQKPLKKTFTIVAIPDTQVYSEEEALTPIFASQIQWVLDNREEENIVFVTHLGDVVDNGDDQAQWDNALSALAPLFAAPNKLPYSICQGNHDGVDLYTLYLGPERYEDKPWYIGASPNKLNHAQIFKVQKREFLHLNIEKFPGEEAFQWAQSIIDNPLYHGLPTIVSTHDYVVYGGRGPVGENIWQNFVKTNPQIFMVLNGHTHTEYYFVSHNEAGKPVFQMLSDYQDREHGGQGLMRLIRINEEAGTVDVETFSPGYAIEDDEEIITVEPFFEEDADSRFTLAANLFERFNPDSTYDFGPEPELPPLPPADPITLPATHIFQQRLNGYSCTIDTQMNENNPDLDYAGELTMTTDMDDNGSRVNGLLGFMDIVGDGPGRIAPGATITSAKLLFYVMSGSDGFVSFHRMRLPWDEYSVWYDFTPQPVQWEEIIAWDPDEDDADVAMTVMVGGGIQADGIEAVTAADAVITCPKPYVTPFIVDVTASVQAWANGEINYGWALLNNSTDGWDFITSHGGNPPALVVEVAGAPYIQQ